MDTFFMSIPEGEAEQITILFGWAKHYLPASPGVPFRKILRAKHYYTIGTSVYQ